MTEISNLTYLSILTEMSILTEISNLTKRSIWQKDQHYTSTSPTSSHLMILVTYLCCTEKKFKLLPSLTVLKSECFKKAPKFCMLLLRDILMSMDGLFLVCAAQIKALCGHSSPSSLISPSSFSPQMSISANPQLN